MDVLHTASLAAIEPMIMPDLTQLYLFSVASVVILLMPGPAVLYVVVQSINQGRLAGAIAVLGLEFGTGFHVVATAFSISSLPSLSNVEFNILKGVGAVYLIYLGIHKLLTHRRIQPLKIQHHKSLQRVFWQGFMVELLNPKTMLFFLAFLPQFVDLTKGSVEFQMLILGFLFVGLAIVIDSLYAALAGSMGRLLKEQRWFMKGHRYLESSVYIGLALIIALSGTES